MAKKIKLISMQMEESLKMFRIKEKVGVAHPAPSFCSMAYFVLGSPKEVKLSESKQSFKTFSKTQIRVIFSISEIEFFYMKSRAFLSRLPGIFVIYAKLSDNQNIAKFIWSKYFQFKGEQFKS